MSVPERVPENLALSDLQVLHLQLEFTARSPLPFLL